MPDVSLYLFDGYNLLRASEYEDARELVDVLASFVALRGARGVVVFDGVGADASYGPLAVRYAPHADTLLERLAADFRSLESVLLVTSDATLATASGAEVAKRSSASFLRELVAVPRPRFPGPGIAGRLDEATRAKLERLRRGETD
jgi:predicted RNA-binding protein with PIN domain